jgi:Tol biopolymer transport system component
MRPLVPIACCAAALGLSACAVGIPKPVTRDGITSVTLHGNVYSSLDGDVGYWWRYGTTPAYGLETPRRAVTADALEANVVSEPLTGLTPGATYHFQFCVKDAQESPERICSGDHDFVANPPAGRIAFGPSSSRINDPQIDVMYEDGSNVTQLTYTPDNDLRAAWSPDGSKIAFMSSRDAPSESEIYVMEADGDGQTAITHDAARADYPAWSPDGSRIAFASNRSGDVEIWAMDADGDNLTRLTNSPGNDEEPAWSPDGSKIAFVSLRAGGPQEIWSMNADGGSPTRLTSNSRRDEDPAWSPDGTRIAFTAGDGPAADIHVMDPDGGGEVAITDDELEDHRPAWSPDGSRIAFSSIRDTVGGPDIWVMDADGDNLAFLHADATDPAWWAPPTSVPTATAGR